MKSCGVIGAGNMAQALFNPMHGFFSNNFSKIKIYTPSGKRARELGQTLGGVSAKSLQELEDCDVVILAHKPQQLMDVAQAFRPKKKCLIISMLAAIETKKIQQVFDIEDVLRIMPNTPAMVGRGIIMYFSTTKSQEIDQWIDGFSQYSLVKELAEEKLIDILTPELGSGPGLAFEILRVFSSSLEQKGFSSKQADQFAAEVFGGACKMVQETGERPEELRDKVTSKGGITQACLEVLAQKNIEEIFHQSFKSGHNRSLELGQ